MRKIISSGIAIIFIVVVVYFVYQSISEDNEFKKGGVITNAIITNAGSDYKGRLQLDYFYFVNGRKIQDRDINPQLNLVAGRELIGKTIPLAYLKTKIDRNILLLTAKNFAMAGESFPDSMQWIKKYEMKW